jgi:hypothetical protein
MSKKPTYYVVQLRKEVLPNYGPEEQIIIERVRHFKTNARAHDFASRAGRYHPKSLFYIRDSDGN